MWRAPQTRAAGVQPDIEAEHPRRPHPADPDPHGSRTDAFAAQAARRAHRLHGKLTEASGRKPLTSPGAAERLTIRRPQQAPTQEPLSAPPVRRRGSRQACPRGDEAACSSWRRPPDKNMGDHIDRQPSCRLVGLPFLEMTDDHGGNHDE